MYKRELENLINKKALPNAMFLYGACFYQIGHFGDKIVHLWSDGVDESMNFYFDAYDFSAIKNYLSQSSLFGDKNIAVIKTEKLIAKKELDILVQICQKTQNSYLLLQNYKEEKKTVNMSKSFSKKNGGDFVRFFKPNMGEAMQMLNDEARKKGLNVQGYALNYLYQAQNEDLSLAINELDKLSILEKEITKKDIDSLVYGLGEVGLESFISSLIDKKDVRENFKVLLEGGHYNHVEIINALQKYIIQLYLFHLYVKINGNIDIKSILGYNLPRDLATLRSNQCMRINPQTFKNLLEALALSEYKIKTDSKLDKDAYLLSVILKIQSILK